MSERDDLIEQAYLCIHSTGNMKDGQFTCSSCGQKMPLNNWLESNAR